MAIEFRKVTWYSQTAAIILFVGVFALGFYLGEKNQLENSGSFCALSNSSVGS